MNTNHELLDKFLYLQEAILKKHDEASAPITDSLLIKVNADESPLVLSFCIHGNETIGLSIAIKILEDFFNEKLQLTKNTLFILGNREALLANKRFINRDLNRSFLNAKQPVLSEEKRAKEIESITNNAAAFFDIHQTTADCIQPFFIIPSFDKNFIQTDSLSLNLPIVTYPSGNFSDDGFNFSAFTQKFNAPFTTIELGKQGFDQNLFDLGYNLAIKFLTEFDKIDFNQAGYVSKNESLWTWNQVIKNEGEKTELVSNLKNFSQIKKGHELYYLNGKPMPAPEDGIILFPKYGEYKRGAAELVRILKKL